MGSSRSIFGHLPPARSTRLPENGRPWVARLTKSKGNSSTKPRSLP